MKSATAETELLGIAQKVHGLEEVSDLLEEIFYVPQRQGQKHKYKHRDRSVCEKLPMGMESKNLKPRSRE